MAAWLNNTYYLVWNMIHFHLGVFRFCEQEQRNKTYLGSLYHCISSGLIQFFHFIGYWKTPKIKLYLTMWYFFTKCLGSCWPILLITGSRKLPKTGWASSNVACHHCTTFYSTKTWTGNCPPPFPPIFYAPVINSTRVPKLCCRGQLWQNGLGIVLWGFLCPGLWQIEM